MKFSLNEKKVELEFNEKEAIVIIPLILTFLFYFKFPNYVAIFCLIYYTLLILYILTKKVVPQVRSIINKLKCPHCKSKDVIKNTYGITIGCMEGYDYDGYLCLSCGEKSFYNDLTSKLYKM